MLSFSIVVVGYIMFVVSVAAPSIVEGESVVGWIVGASEVEDLTVTEETVAVVLIDTVFVVCLSSSVPTFSSDGSFFILTVNKDALSGEDVADVVLVLNRRR
jgi:hypothetical protein